MTYEVDRPIQNSPFAEPAKHWYIQRGRDPKLVDLRRDSFVFGPKNRSEGWDLSDGTLRAYKRDAEGNDYEDTYELALVNALRARVSAWRNAGYPGVTRTTLELLRWWRRDGRPSPSAPTIIREQDRPVVKEVGDFPRWGNRTSSVSYPCWHDVSVS